MMTMLPETILQFGSGRFLRGFADLFIHHGNLNGQAVGRVVVVQSTGDGRADSLNRFGGKYPVAIRGYENGTLVDRTEECGSISRALFAGSQWNDVLGLATRPELATILTNTTEAGYALHPDDSPDSSPPRSFPAKLLAVLQARWHAGQPPLTIIPCELIEGNAEILRGIVARLASDWNLPHDLQAYIHDSIWLQTLVDRIVTAPPTTENPLAVVAEPFACFVLEDNPRTAFRLQHSAIVRAKDVTPYFLRKVRILNAAHTALVIKASRDYTWVREAMNDPAIETWLRRLLFEEIVPTLEGRIDAGEWFAEQTLDRFRNPYLDHRFADIAVHHETKIRVRLLPTQDEYLARFGRQPRLLSDLLSGI